MSVTEKIEALALEWSCSYCGAGVGEWCVTHHWQDRAHLSPPTGRAAYLHGHRTQKVFELWRHAYKAGVQDGRAQGHWQIARALKAHAAYGGGELQKWLEQRADAINRGAI